MKSQKTKSILFLGYDKFQTKIIEALEDKNCKVTHQSSNLNKISNDFDIIVSFGFKHIIKNDLLQSITAPILNLHQSYLPWNKGAHPNFWSFWDNTPAGVTIHKIDSGIDTGPIVIQKIFEFDEKKETFRTTYEKLFTELENLFISNIDKIINLEFETQAQRGSGTFHYKNDLPKEFVGWDAKIFDEINRLEGIGFSPHNELLQLIDQIEMARSLNNVNWMNLLRIVAVESPEKLAEITSKINASDSQISELFKKLSSRNKQ